MLVLYWRHVGLKHLRVHLEHFGGASVQSYAACCHLQGLGEFFHLVGLSVWFGIMCECAGLFPFSLWSVTKTCPAAALRSPPQERRLNKEEELRLRTHGF
jgi:hypothetical protein